MKATWDFAMHVLGTMPVWLAAMLVGWGLSWGLTQTLKFAVPETVDARLRHVLNQALAFLSAAVPAGLYYWQHDQTFTGLVLVAVAAGVWSPMAFAILQAVLRRFFPWLADALSGDKRGVIAAKLRGES